MLQQQDANTGRIIVMVKYNIASIGIWYPVAAALQLVVKAATECKYSLLATILAHAAAITDSCQHNAVSAVTNSVTVCGTTVIIIIIQNSVGPQIPPEKRACNLH
jgi:hypothetical protein